MEYTSTDIPMLSKVLDFFVTILQFLWNLIVTIVQFIFTTLNRVFTWLGTLRWSRMKRRGKNISKFLGNPIVQIIVIAISVFIQSTTTIVVINNILSWVIVGTVFLLVSQNFKGLFRFLYK
jgi:phage-related protein